MVKAVFISNPQSRYDDRPGELYHFPNRSYLSRVAQTVGDWVIFYQGRRSGSSGYQYVQKVLDIRPDPLDPAASYAVLDLGTLLQFEQVVPRQRMDGRPYETGLPNSGGSNASAVRMLSEADFSAIITAGLAPVHDPDGLPRLGPLPPAGHQIPTGVGAYGLQETGVPFAPAPLRPEVLSTRAFRDPIFARNVKRAYRGRCAMSGLALRNGGGRPEVEAAHIVPVANRGPDTINNGLALSGTVHWMFDRGLVSVGTEGEILVATDPDTRAMASRLLLPERQLLVPDEMDLRPHASYFTWHRENKFKG